MISFIKKIFFARFRSLKLSMFYAMIVGILLASSTFAALQVVSSAYIDNNYLSSKAREEREKKYLDELQKYVSDRQLKSSDTGKLAEWVKGNRYLYVMIYKDDQLLFDSGSVGEIVPGDADTPDDPTLNSGTGSGDNDTDTPGSTPDPDIPTNPDNPGGTNEEEKIPVRAATRKMTTARKRINTLTPVLL